MNIQAFQTELLRVSLFWSAIELIAFIVVMWVLYLVVKAAVRDGIKEAGLVGTWERTVARERRKDGDRGEYPTLPEMRAD